MEKKIHDVMTESGASHSVAKGLLEDNDWNVSQSIKIYRFMSSKQNISYPGPQKNMEQELANAAASTGGGGPISQGLLEARSTATTNGKQTPPVPGSPNTKARLKRGLSKTTENIFLVHKARDIVLNDISETDSAPSTVNSTQHFVETPEFTFILPDLTVYPDDFRAFLHKDLIETSTLVSLEQAGRLNWWADAGICQRLMPLATTGDGNCLLHAASLAMWGFHDRLLTLRTALFQNLTKSMSKGSLWRRWRWHQTQVNKQSGLVYTDKEWQAEWENLLKLASNKPRTTPGSHVSCCNSPTTKGLMERVGSEKESALDKDEDAELFYESLEELHVFILAHVLRRPVIVVADTILKDSNGDALAPIPFGGLYLPLLCEPEECHRSPLLLTYDASHFSALVAMETTKDAQKDESSPLPGAIPLVDPDLHMLPIHYMIDPGPNTIWGKHDNDTAYIHSLQLSIDQQLKLIQKYLDVDRLPLSNNTTTATSEDGSTESRESRSRTNSCGSSLDSDENSVGSSGSFKEKGKVGGKVARKLGSIGKSMGKRFRRNLGGNKLKNGSGDADRAKMPPPMYPPPRKPSGGMATQSSRNSGVNNENDSCVLVTRLSDHRVKYQDELVYNYLQAAEERFKADREQKQAQEAELLARGGTVGATNGPVKKSEPTSQLNNAQYVSNSPTTPLSTSVNNTKTTVTNSNARTQCINTGCSKIGSSVTSYLCQQCFDQQRKEAMNLQKGAPMASSVQMPPLSRHDTLFTTGKSKFYTDSEEEQQTPPLRTSNGPTPPQVAPKPTLTQTKAFALNNNRSPSSGISVAAAKAGFYNNNVNINTTSQNSSTNAIASNNRTNMEITRNNLAENGVAKSTHVRWGSANTSGANTLPRFRPTTIDDDLKEPPLRREFVATPLVGKPASNNTTPVRSSVFKVKVNSESCEDKSKSECLNGEGLKRDSQQPCRTKGCDFYGCDANDFLCSACFKQKQRTKGKEVEMHSLTRL